MDNANALENIYLVGLMGSGKTTIGRTLAKRLEREFIDSDRVIEARTGVSIPTIFEIEGEDGFRKREMQVIADIAEKRGVVCATGGGVVLRPENRERMRASGFVAYLDVPPHQLWERTKRDRNRPLLQVEDPLRRLHELHEQRDALYREVADRVIDGSRLHAQDILKLLLGEVEARCNS